ncbi:LPXTG cell wall anchor domain-containing protein [Streptomyces sp. NBRC 109706]|uniref:LPXTG cell wall anchor domain-containing protein n=1 Tax=Streptomyces sp. NBRC 109706 TaxID=1550035 RepID=UPI000785B902|nr:LPXTG cell wall anchor domain-containing protein [Streptomyces sp. NBRC 109706]
MRRRLPRTTRTALALGTGALLALGAAPAAAAPATVSTAWPAADDDCQSDPTTAIRGRLPLCGNPAGRTVTITSGPVAPGGTVTFTGTGFVRDVDGRGQTVNLRFNDVDLIGGSFVADDEGNLSGEVTIPDQATLDAYRSEYGAERFWLRFLTGAAATDGEDDAPARSLHAFVELVDDGAADSGGSDSGADGGSGDNGGSDSGGSDAGGSGDSGGSDAGGAGDSGGSDASGTAGSAGAEAGSGGRLPETGVDDSSALTWAAALAAGAAGIFVVDRAVRRRRAPAE